MKLILLTLVLSCQIFAAGVQNINQNLHINYACSLKVAGTISGRIPPADNQDSVLCQEDSGGVIKKLPYPITKVIGGTGVTVTQSTDTFTVSLYEPPNIVSLANDHATSYAGQTVTDIVVSWTLDGADITSQTLTDCSPAIVDRSCTYSGLSLTSDKGYTLNVSDGVESDQATTYVRFYIATFYGTTSSSSPAEADIEAGTTTWEIQTAGSRALSSATIAGGGDYVYYAYPSSWGSVQMYVNGFSSTWIQTTVSVTSVYGDTRDYKVYTSPNVIVGSITLSAAAI